MKIKDFTTGVQHIGIPTNDINKAHPINQGENSLILYKICTFAP